MEDHELGAPILYAYSSTAQFYHPGKIVQFLIFWLRKLLPYKLPRTCCRMREKWWCFLGTFFCHGNLRFFGGGKFFGGSLGLCWLSQVFVLSFTRYIERFFVLGQCYKVLQGRWVHKDAAEACAEKGATLAYARNHAENVSIKSFFKLFIPSTIGLIPK